MNKKLTLLIADDHPLILEGLVKQIEADNIFKIIAVANNGDTAWQLFKKNNPDIAILDIEMNGTNGIELTEKIKKEYPETKVILLTMHTSPWIISQAQNANPNCILFKNMSSQDILNAIHIVNEKETFIPTEIERIINQNSIDLTNIQSLTKREVEVLKLISEGNTTQQIADTLFLSVNTIETYRKNLLLKFETPNVAGLVKKAAELGII